MRSLLIGSGLWWLLLPPLLGGCSSGQTGSPECVPPESCVCDRLYSAGTPLRVHVERFQSDKLEVVIDEVFPSAFGTNGLEAGDRVVGSLELAEPCAPGAPFAPSEGSELFVLFTPGYDEGRPNPLDGWFGWAIDWTDPLSFGGGRELGRSELAVLTDPATCLQHFPADPAPPCNDTPEVTCTAARGNISSDRGFLALGLAALLLYTARRRRKSC